MSCDADDTPFLYGDYNLDVVYTSSPMAVIIGDNDRFWCEQYVSSDIRGSTPKALLHIMSLYDLDQVNVVRNGTGRSIDMFLTNLQPDSLDKVTKPSGTWGYASSGSVC